MNGPRTRPLEEFCEAGFMRQSTPIPLSTSTTADESMSGEGGAQLVKVVLDTGKHTNTVATCALICGMCLIITIYAVFAKDQRLQQAQDDFRDMKTQYKLMERRYMDFEAYALLQGWKVPKDDSFGPTGNLERMAHER